MTKKVKKVDGGMRVKADGFVEDILMWALLSVSFFLRLCLYVEHSPLWDGSVYVLMGKSIFSGGAAGLWEPYRPLLWPCMLGFFWKLGGDPILWGKVLQTLFSLGSIFLVYRIGAQVFNKRVGFLSAAFLSFSPTYFTWGNYLYTGIPSTFLGLVAVYLLLGNKRLLCGIFAGLAFMTRFLQLILFIPLLLAHIFRCRGKDGVFKLVRFLGGFLVIFAVFIVSNLIMYGDAFFPFATARKVLGAYSVLWYHGSWYYIVQLLTKENFCLVFYLLGIFFILKKDRNLKTFTILLLGILFFLSINTSRMQILRYVISALPYLYLVSAYALIEVYDHIKKYRAAAMAVYVLIASLAFFEYRQFRNISFPERKLDVFQEYIEQNKDAIKGPIWVSNPTYLVYSDLKAAELIYYPVFNAERARALQERLGEADLILLHGGDFPCAPQGDTACLEQKGRLIDKIGEDFYAYRHATGPQGQIFAGIFIRKD